MQTQVRPSQIPFTATWRVVHDPDEIHQYRATGAPLVCPAILGGCGPSTKQPGKFWWSVKETQVNPRIGPSYVDSIDEAKACVEQACAPYVAQHTKPIRTVSDFHEGCDLAVEMDRPVVAFVTEQQRKYKFFPSRFYKNA